MLIDGTLFLSTPFDQVIALDPATGAERWKYDPGIDRSKGYSEVTSRGVSAWQDPKTRKWRIFVGTLDARLIALDAQTGKPCSDFGKAGAIDLTRDVMLRDRGDYQVTSTPAIFADLVITGSSIGDNRAVDVERGIVGLSTPAVESSVGPGIRRPGRRTIRRGPAPRMHGPRYP